MIKLVECPRDAMQGLEGFVPTELKAEYINLLLNVGFDTIDFGSFVSPNAIPQMRDTADVLKQLNLDRTSSKLLAIVANERGANDALAFDEISHLGFPFSISETFQLRNTNATIEQSLSKVEKIQSLCVNRNRTLVVYLSMAFGNPYGEEWNVDIAVKWSKRLHKDLGIEIFALSDTIGVAKKDSIESIFSALIPTLPNVEFGAHFHTAPEEWEEKISSAHQAGCKRFDGAIKGYGGCPMAKNELVGNMPTEKMLSFFNSQDLRVDKEIFESCVELSIDIFG